MEKLTGSKLTVKETYFREPCKEAHSHVMQGILKYKLHLRVPGEILPNLRNWGFIFFQLNVLASVYLKKKFSGFSLQMEMEDCFPSFDNLLTPYCIALIEERYLCSTKIFCGSIF